jgi:drug/metabolite transporter (DMT)-like permease
LRWCLPEWLFWSAEEIGSVFRGLVFNSGNFWAIGGAACFGLYSLFTRSRPPEISVAS